MSLYADYIKERTHKSIIERPEGFAVFYCTQLGDEKACYIEEIYVRPEDRCLKVASAMADLIADGARKQGCKWLLGSVCPEAKGATASVQVLIAYGFELLEISGPLILFKKAWRSDMGGYSGGSPNINLGGNPEFSTILVEK